MRERERVRRGHRGTRRLGRTGRGQEEEPGQTSGSFCVVGPRCTEDGDAGSQKIKINRCAYQTPAMQIQRSSSPFSPLQSCSSEIIAFPFFQKGIKNNNKKK